jgi:hypothetical protein
MRIDSSGNLLVGTTDNQPWDNSGTSTGAVLRSDGLISSATNGTSSLELNRLSSDGNFANFRRSGLLVGSIGVVNANNMYLSGSASNHAGVQFGTQNVTPYNNGSQSDGAVDLGAFNLRWKDLYLSGGVYLGGTGSANHLDDYEEGTWTPTLLDGADVSQAIYGASGRYTKIGRTVHVNCALTRNNTVGTSGNLGIGNLPFQCGTSPFLTGGMWIDNGGPSVDTNGIAYMGTNSTIVRGIQITSPGQQSSYRYFQYNNLTNGRFLYLSMTYQTA